jgi:hypothetical protein
LSHDSLLDLRPESGRDLGDPIEELYIAVY